MAAPLVGRQVQISGLASRPDLNGQRVLVDLRTGAVAVQTSVMETPAVEWMPELLAMLEATQLPIWTNVYLSRKGGTFGLELSEHNRVASVEPGGGAHQGAAEGQAEPAVLE